MTTNITGQKASLPYNIVCHRQRNDENVLTGENRLTLKDEAATVLLTQRAGGARNGTLRSLLQYNDGFFAWADTVNLELL